MTHICVGNLTIIGSDNGLSPGRRQAITWTNVGILLIGLLGTNFNEMLIDIHTFSFKKMHLKMSSGKWRPFCLGLNVLIIHFYICIYQAHVCIFVSFIFCVCSVRNVDICIWYLYKTNFAFPRALYCFVTSTIPGYFKYRFLTNDWFNHTKQSETKRYVLIHHIWAII